MFESVCVLMGLVRRQSCQKFVLISAPRTGSQALNRHRSKSEPAITVQNVSVADGGNAIVGNVTQHANVMVSDTRAAAAAAARGVPISDLSEPEPDPVDVGLTAQA